MHLLIRGIAQWLLPVLFLLNYMPARAQYPLLRHFTTRDGLPSNVVYDIYNDSKGFIWFSTDQGISRFDGNRFVNYNINEGLPDNEVFKILEDDRGRYWPQCYNHKACYLKDGKVYSSENDSLCRFMEAQGISSFALFESRNGIFYLAGKRLFSPSKAIRIPSFPAKPIAFGSHFHTEIDGKHYLILQGTAYIGNKDGTYRTQFLFRPELLSVGKYTTNRPGRRFYQVAGSYGEDSLYAMTFDTDSVRITHRDLMPALCYEIVCETDTSVLCLTNKGAYDYIEQSGTFRKSRRLPANIVVNRMLRDREGNTWLSTLTEGVYVEGRHAAILYNRSAGLPQDAILNLCTADSETIIACCNKGAFSQITRNRVHNMQQQGEEINRVQFAYKLSKGRFLVGGDRGLLLMNANGTVAKSLLTEAQKACFRLGHRYFICHSGGSLCYDDSTNKTFQLSDKRATSIATRDGRTVWLGSLNGLHYWRDGLMTRFDKDDELNGNRIVDLDIAGDHYLVIATHRSGIYTWDGHTLQHINRASGLASNNCTAICTDTAGTIWVCTDQGLDRISRGSSQNAGRIYHYSAMDGILDAKINDIARQGPNLCLATAEGLVILNEALKKPDPIPPPSVHLLSIVSRDTVINWPTGLLTFDHNKNSLHVNYVGVILTAGAKLQYRYVLEGAVNDTVYTSLGVTLLSNLKPGHYRMTIWAKYDAMPGWTGKPAVLSFRILPPFWLTTWFLLLAGSLSGLSLYCFYRAKIRAVRRKETVLAKQQHYVAALKMQALRSQINPHFLFNVLNSIQHFYSRHEDRKANQYMSLFTKLIRKALENSEHHWLTLSDELDLLLIYLNLEQMRFKNAFAYTLHIDPHIDRQVTMIPSMLIQPYLENAIGHGLRGLQDRQGLLQLSFVAAGDTLVCTIDDNGIGINNSRKLKSSAHISFGMKLTQQRIDTMNALYRMNIRVTITDKTALDTPGSGTQIVLHIPARSIYE